jgi:hypothetical protein
MNLKKVRDMENKKKKTSHGTSVIKQEELGDHLPVGHRQLQL